MIVIYNNMKCNIVIRNGNYVTLQNIETGTFYLSVNINLCKEVQNG